MGSGKQSGNFDTNLKLAKIIAGGGGGATGATGATGPTGPTGPSGPSGAGGGGGGLLAVVSSTSISSTPISSTTPVAFDTTNATISFKTNASGPGSTSVLVKVSASFYGTSVEHGMIAMATHDTVTLVSNAFEVLSALGSSSLGGPASAAFLVTGLSPDTSYQWDVVGWSSNGDALYFIDGTLSGGWDASAVIEVWAGTD